MNKRRISSKLGGIVCTTCVALAFVRMEANPLSFPEYEQEIVAKFATPDEAATATVSLLAKLTMPLKFTFIPLRQV